VKFLFRSKSGQDLSAREWLTEWEHEYPSERFPEDDYEHLIQNGKSLSEADFIRMGKWKDNAWTDAKWSPNAASVAFLIWQEAAREIPGQNPDSQSAQTFLEVWSERQYPDPSSRSKSGNKRFGVSRSTTLLHFMTSGRYPIFDSHVITAVKRLTGAPAPKTVHWYLHSYRAIFAELMTRCSASQRSLDKALFAYGKKHVQAFSLKDLSKA
jgi:hypothetical protein